MKKCYDLIEGRKSHASSLHLCLLTSTTRLQSEVAVGECSSQSEVGVSAFLSPTQVAVAQFGQQLGNFSFTEPSDHYSL